jgi:TetR/AcrR family transcriptional regulator, tetracycline repressor protein
MARRDEVLAAALELLDEVGLDALTTRRLAATLGIQAGSLYRHYPSKQALLDAMAEHLLARVAREVPPPEADWDDACRRVATATRAAMLARRDGARLLTAFHGAPDVGERVYWDLVERLVTAGLPSDTANIAVDTLFGYVNGFTIEEQAAQRGDDEVRFRAGVEVILDGIRLRLPVGTPRPA